MQTETQEPKRRGRPPKVRPAEPSCGHEYRPSAEPAGSAAPRKKPSPPVLAKEIIDFILSRYDWNPGDWRAILTTFAYAGNLGRYWSQQTGRKK